MSESTITAEIAAYEGLRQALETDHLGEWALLHNRELISLFGTFEAAAQEAVRRFGRGPYLIRQVGAPPVALPASVVYQPEYGALRIR